MSDRRLGLLHPGQMGASVGAAATGHSTVLWASEERSAETVERARAARLEERRTVAEVVDECAVLVSVCPPDAAADLARSVAGLGFAGIYVDANAVSPETTGRIARIIEDGGARFVDGGLVGPPAWKEGTTRFFLSGPGAPTVAELFADSPLEALAIGQAVGSASALKMAYAAYTKGHAALLLAVRALARIAGCEDDLLAEWARSQPVLPERSTGAARATAPKAWRFEGEMREIADTFRSSGLPPGFHEAAEEVYRRLEHFKNEKSVEPDDVLEALRLPSSEKRPPTTT